ncbi:MAG: hypothetical protein WCW44_01645 [archaeon]|jgi:hypothetical protein
MGLGVAARVKGKYAQAKFSPAVSKAFGRENALRIAGIPLRANYLPLHSYFLKPSSSQALEIYLAELRTRKVSKGANTTQPIILAQAIVAALKEKPKNSEALFSLVSKNLRMIKEDGEAYEFPKGKKLNFVVSAAFRALFYKGIVFSPEELVSKN